MVMVYVNKHTKNKSTLTKGTLANRKKRKKAHSRTKKNRKHNDRHAHKSKKTTSLPLFFSHSFFLNFY